MKMKKEWTQNLTVTQEEQDGLKAIMAAQQARREAAKKEYEEQCRSLKEIRMAQLKKQGRL
jgi:hypothetical protein